MLRSLVDGEHTTPNDVKIIGRYTVDSPFAAGGMASVHLGRAKGPLGFSRTVAVKRLLPELASDPNVTARFVDEARLASRIRHVNVVPTLDVVAEQDDLLLVMEYVAGLSLSAVLGQPGVALGTADAPRIPLPIVSAIMTDVLEGLHAAHTATTEAGERLSLVHRDVSPQNVLVGSDGIARVIDFGIATASEQLHRTNDESVRGKIGYMAPEQLRGDNVTFSADVYGASVMLWELLAHRRLATNNVEEFIERVHLGDHDGPRKYSPAVPIALEEIVMQGLAASPARRFSSAHDMAVALQSACPRASALDVSAWLDGVAAGELRRRAEDVARFESMPEGRLSHARPSTLGLVAYDPTVTITERLRAAEPASTRERQPAAAPRPRRRSRLAAMAVVACAAAVIVALLLLRDRSTARTSAAAAAESSGVASASASAVPAPPTSDDPVAPPAAVPAPARVAGAHHATKSAAPTGAAAHPLPTTSTASCKVPFYFDADGTKHYRPECVR
jgi:hypothetical protein